MTAEPSSEKLNGLRPLQWSNRILLVFPESDSDTGLAEELKANQAEIDDRDIAWFVFSGDGVESNFQKPLASTFGKAVRERYAPNSGELEVVLIGKDGGVKDRYDRLDLPEVFARIDSMPMRQAEMRRD